MDSERFKIANIIAGLVILIATGSCCLHLDAVWAQGLLRDLVLGSVAWLMYNSSRETK
jgi:ABC-type uncharacterized transport system permease subunit